MGSATCKKYLFFTLSVLLCVLAFMPFALVMFGAAAHPRGMIYFLVGGGCSFPLAVLFLIGSFIAIEKAKQYRLLEEEEKDDAKNESDVFVSYQRVVKVN